MADTVINPEIRTPYRDYLYIREMFPVVTPATWAKAFGNECFFHEVRYQRTLNCAFDLEVASVNPEYCPNKNECPKCGMCANHCGCSTPAERKVV